MVSAHGSRCRCYDVSGHGPSDAALVRRDWPFVQCTHSASVLPVCQKADRGRACAGSVVCIPVPTWPASCVGISYILSMAVSLSRCPSAVLSRPMGMGERREKAFVLISWLVVSGSALGYALVAERVTQLPSLVSAFHFQFLLRTASWLLFGCGVMFALRWLQGRLVRLGRGLSPAVAQCAVVVMLVVATYPRYLRPRGPREHARQGGRRMDCKRMSRYTCGYAPTQMRPVCLCRLISDALQIVGPAGRYVVSVPAYFSNPYVDHAARQSARNAILGAAMLGDSRAFVRLRDQLGVSHVLVRGNELTAFRQNARAMVVPVYEQGSVAVFEVR